MENELKFCKDCVFGNLRQGQRVDFGKNLGPIPTILFIPPRINRRCLNVLDKIKRIPENVPFRAPCDKPKSYARKSTS